MAATILVQIYSRSLCLRGFVVKRSKIKDLRLPARGGFSEFRVIAEVHGGAENRRADDVDRYRQVHAAIEHRGVGQIQRGLECSPRHFQANRLAPWVELKNKALRLIAKTARAVGRERR